jgi:hypothetical protein
MADFCKECSIELFGKDFGDLAKLLAESEYTATIGASALCEGCGDFISVDYEGNCRSTVCPKHGKRNLQLYNEAIALEKANAKD